MKERIAIIDGLRTPMGKAGGVLRDISADDLGARVVKELMVRIQIHPDKVDEVIIGNVAQPANAANIARVIALKAGLPIRMIAYTVHRNCASGMEAITTAANKILTGEANIILAGGTESMSHIPLLFNKKMTNLFQRLFKAKSVWQKLAIWGGFRPSFLMPVIGISEGLTDPVCGLNMGQTAEVLAREFHISRDEQDKFALLSHQRAVTAAKKGIFAEEMMPLPLPPRYETIVKQDEGPRDNQSLGQLGKLKPYFDRYQGTVTVGNACPINDGAAAVLVMTESKAKAEGYQPLGYLRDYAYASLEPQRMGLGPVYATSKLLQKSKLSMKDIELIEMNEAFAAQVIANERAFASAEFSKKYLESDKAIGEIDRNKLNVNGGAIALGHPVGMTGTRLVITLLKEMKRRKFQRGLATLCIGGGQGAALLLETV